MAAQEVGGETFVQAGVAIFVTGMITYSNVSNLKDTRKLLEIAFTLIKAVTNMTADIIKWY